MMPRLLSAVAFALSFAVLVPFALPLVLPTRFPLKEPPAAARRGGGGGGGAHVPLRYTVSLVLALPNASALQPEGVLEDWARLHRHLAALLRPSKAQVDSHVFLAYDAGLQFPSQVSAPPLDADSTVIYVVVAPGAGVPVTHVKHWGLVTSLDVSEALPTLWHFLKDEVHIGVARKRDSALRLLKMTYDLTQSLGHIEVSRRVADTYHLALELVGDDAEVDRAHALAHALATDPSIVPTMYISNQNRAAIFAPLVVPASIPVVIGLATELKAVWRRRSSYV